jgi:hypothetical protein
MACPRCGRAYHKTNRPPNRPYSPVELDLIEIMAGAGYTAREIATMMHPRSADNIRNICRRYRWRLAPAKPGAPIGNTNARRSP